MRVLKNITKGTLLGAAFFIAVQVGLAQKGVSASDGQEVKGWVAKHDIDEDRPSVRKPRVITGCFSSIEVDVLSTPTDLNTMNCNQAKAHASAFVLSASTTVAGCGEGAQFCCAELVETTDPNCPEIEIDVDGEPITGRFVVGEIYCWD